ncbi:MAG: hypothetical protein AAFX94_13200 [Myxococcota bacterium]
MRRSLSGVFVVMLTCACAGGAHKGKGLRVAVDSYHDSLRWKRLTAASRFRTADQRSEFLAKYLAVEEDLSIDSIEVRDVSFVPDSDPLAANVVLTAETYLLPSTVLKKHVITERWEQYGDAWRLVETSHEFAPGLETRAPSTPGAPTADTR